MKEFFKSLKTKEGWLRVFMSFAWIIPLVLIIDLSTKWIMKLALSNNGGTIFPGKAVIPNFFYLWLQFNTGAAWSFLDGLNGDFPWGRIILLFISIAMSVVLMFFYIKKFKSLNTLYRIGLTMMAAGAMGNLVDRLFYWEPLVGHDGVIDFLSFHLWYPKNGGWTYYPFPTFNIADSSLVIGAIVLLVAVIIEMVVEAIEKGKNGEYKYSPKEMEKMKENSPETEEKIFTNKENENDQN